MKSNFNNFEEVKNYLIEKEKVCLQATKDSFGFFTKIIKKICKNYLTINNIYSKMVS